MRGSLGLREAAKICSSIQVGGPGLKPRGRQLKQFLHQITLLRRSVFQHLWTAESHLGPHKVESLSNVCGVRPGGDKESGLHSTRTPALFLLLVLLRLGLLFP